MNAVRRAYGAWARTYDQDRNLTRDLDAEALRDTFAGKRLRNVLELGCGTGKNTVFLVEIARALQCLDFSERMLAVARRKVSSDRVAFAHADLTKPWPCREGSVDQIVCDLVLEHIEDLPFVFAQARRALRPGGGLFISELHPFRQYQGKRATFVDRGRSIDVPAFVHHVSDFVRGADENGFLLDDLREWWHAEDVGKPPRLVTFRFLKKKGRRP